MDLSKTGLRRFLEAQEPVYEQVCRELAVGQKVSHWMWFIFPQLRELGRSQYARHFGIESEHEARAYLDHPVLGARLRACSELLLSVSDKSANEIMGSPDDLKLRSCLTLFSVVGPHEVVFEQALARFFAGERDLVTMTLVNR